MELKEIIRELNLQAEYFAPFILKQEPSDKSSNSFRFGENGKIAVYTQGPKRGKWVDFSADRRGDMLDLIAYVNGKTKAGKEEIDFAKNWLRIPENKRSVEHVNISREKAKENEKKRQDTALWIYEKSEKITAGGILYLKNRGLMPDPIIRGRFIPKSILIEKMRVAEADLVGIDGLDSLIFPSRNHLGVITAIQQVLTYQGKKAAIKTPKITNGILLGSGIRFGSGEHVILSEGPETGLSLYQSTSIPTVVALGRVNLALIEFGPEVKRVSIAADLGEPGEKAAQLAFKTLTERGKAVRIIRPILDDPKADFNDQLQKMGADSIRSQFLT